MNFLITNEFALLLTFENIENRSLKHKLEFAALYLYDDNRSFKTGIEEIDFIYEKLKKFFELNRKSSKPFYCIWPVILISESISWKLIAVLKNVFEGYNVHYNDKDNSIDNCNNFNFLQEILTILEDLNSSPTHSDSIVKVYKHLREIDLNEEMTDEDLLETLKYIRLISY